MKQHLNLKQTQQLNLSPQLKQAIKLLQCSQIDFDMEIKNYLDSNPLLEITEDSNSLSEAEAEAISPEDSLYEDSSPATENDVTTFDSDSADWQWSNVSGHNHQEEDLDPMLNVAQPFSLRETLLSQLSEYTLETRDKAIVTLLIEELDSRGMLTTPLSEIEENLPLDLMIEEEDLLVGLRLLQQFEPAGVGARNIQESLLIQAKSKVQDTDALLAQYILKEHFDLLTNKKTKQLAKKMSLPEHKIEAAISFITSLNPYPTSSLATTRIQYISPDIKVINIGGKWVAQLNRRNIPNVQLNQLYAQAVAMHEGKTELSASLQEAQWLLKSIEQRFDTISSIAAEIVERQQLFFNDGDIAMKPLTLKDISSKLEIHESTVSRACTQKYLVCPKGIFELKYFFNQSIQTQNHPSDSSDDDTTSNLAIKAKIKTFIANEDTTKPYSDEKISQLLKKENITIARRTVSKYRESMHIPTARERRS